MKKYISIMSLFTFQIYVLNNSKLETTDLAREIFNALKGG